MAPFFMAALFVTSPLHRYAAAPGQIEEGERSKWGERKDICPAVGVQFWRVVMDWKMDVMDWKYEPYEDESGYIKAELAFYYQQEQEHLEEPEEAELPDMECAF